MKRLFILSGVVGLALAGVAGCASGDRMATIVAPEGSTGSSSTGSSKTLPAADPVAGSDETITPTSPAAPAVAPAVEPAPAPVVEETKTEEATKPSEGDKTVEKAPETKSPAEAGKVEDLIAIIPFLPAKKMKAVHPYETFFVECRNDAGGSCAGDAAKSATLFCPPETVVVGYESGAGAFPDGWSPDGAAMEGEVSLAEGEIGGDDGRAPIVGGLRIKCAPIYPTKVDQGAMTYASDTDLVNTVFDNGENCLPNTALANGIFGRSGSRLDSFGLSCGHYWTQSDKVGVFPDAKYPETISGPGTGGVPFEVKCDVNQAVVGMTFNYGINVHGPSGIYCADLEPIF